MRRCRLRSPTFASRRAWEEFSALLEPSGAGYYSARAYRRAAEVVRAAPRRGRHARRRKGESARCGASGQGLRPGCASWSRRATSQSSPSPAVHAARARRIGRFIGIGAKRAVQIRADLGTSSVVELRAAARQGGLREAARDRREHGGEDPRCVRAGAPSPHARPGLFLRARALTEAIAAALGGIRRRRRATLAGRLEAPRGRRALG